jgi:hypothetical protein
VRIPRGGNYALTPEAIWQEWHAKDAVEPPAMPWQFPAEYYYQCERIGGADFADDIRRLSGSSVDDVDPRDEMEAAFDRAAELQCPAFVPDVRGEEV